MSSISDPHRGVKLHLLVTPTTGAGSCRQTVSVVAIVNRSTYPSLKRELR